MPASESPSIIDEYTQTFTSLQAGKRELIQWGADTVALNRFIVDAAEATDELSLTPVLQTVDLAKVAHGDSDEERVEYCDKALRKLITLQEEVVVLQKTAREKGISGGLLTIIGQAANQSPGDNGASVLRQLSQLVQGQDVVEKSPQPSADISLDDTAANDIDRLDHQRMTGLQQVTHTMREHWKPFAVDAAVCALASGIAISLIN